MRANCYILNSNFNRLLPGETSRNWLFFAAYFFQYAYKIATQDFPYVAFLVAAALELCRDRRNLADILQTEGGLAYSVKIRS